jgi:hypothetical protein
MYKSAYLSLKEQYDSLLETTKTLKSQLGKSLNHQETLSSEIKLQKVMLKRISRESSIECKGWVMSDYEKELEKGWSCFKVPEEPEIVKQETPSKFSEKVKIEEESEYDEELPVVIKKKRSEPPPLVPEVEDAKRLLHVLFKNPKLTWPFEEPVDPVSLNIPDYPQIVKNPMDIGTIRKRLHDGYYNEQIEYFVKDIRRVFMNAVIYNDPYHQIHKLAIQCSNIFEKKLDKSKPIVPPLPLGLGRSSRWKQGIAWRRANVEESICWRAQGYQKIQAFARNPFRE